MFFQYNTFFNYHMNFAVLSLRKMQRTRMCISAHFESAQKTRTFVERAPSRTYLDEVTTHWATASQKSSERALPLVPRIICFGVIIENKEVALPLCRT